MAPFTNRDISLRANKAPSSAPGISRKPKPERRRKIRYARNDQFVLLFDPKSLREHRVLKNHRLYQAIFASACRAARWKNRASPYISDHAGANSLCGSGFKGVSLPWYATTQRVNPFDQFQIVTDRHRGLYGKAVGPVVKQPIHRRPSPILGSHRPRDIRCGLSSKRDLWWPVTPRGPEVTERSDLTHKRT